MICPFCGFIETRVLDSRGAEDDTSIRRRRECISCKKRFTTYERSEEVPLTVIKKDGSRVIFDRRKLVNSMLTACRRRGISYEQIETVANRIERYLRKNKNKEVESEYIGRLVMEALLNLDKVAYVRFASVFKEFSDVSCFISEIESLVKRRNSSF